MSDKQFPDNWRISEDYDPNQHMLSLKGKDYLTVQNRLLWFVRDQRELIMRGLATMPYIIRTELVEHDRDAGYAQFRTYVRDVLGNEATMYGSETAHDFGDYAEKASTKSLGRALLLLGYGTGMAPEMDEGDRVVDSPVERRRSDASARPASPPARRDTPRTASEPSPTAETVSQPPQRVSTQDTPRSSTKEQRDMLAKGAAAMGRTLELDDALTFDEAETMLAAWRREWQQMNMRKQPAPGTYDSRAGLGDLSTLNTGHGGGRH